MNSNIDSVNTGKPSSSRFMSFERGEISGKSRSSNLELYRIIVMFLIVMHHYVVNSGLMDVLNAKTFFSLRDYVLLVLGCWGKTGINCFVLITGYFMCTSHITKRKFMKLFLEMYFYDIAIWGIFSLCGYESISLKSFLKMIFPFFYVQQNFTVCFLIFYLFIPFLNKLVNTMDEKSHRLLLVLSLFVYTVLPTFAFTKIDFNYVTWFCILYIVASYIRLYPMKWMSDNRVVGVLMAVSVMLSIGSVVSLGFITRLLNKGVGNSYHFLSDSNKVLALTTAIFSFLYFRNLKINNSKIINKIAGSTFGVLMIHANSDTMRQWLWKDICDVTGSYEKMGGGCILHALCCVLMIYIACTVIDLLRIWGLEKARKCIRR